MMGWLREWRLSNDITQHELGLLLGHRGGTLVSKWECGKRDPTPKQLAAVTAVAEVLKDVAECPKP